jgi:hypothetical protein
MSRRDIDRANIPTPQNRLKNQVIHRSCNMLRRKLGALEVSELGFGILSFASTYGQAPEQAESIRVISGCLRPRHHPV